MGRILRKLKQVSFRSFNRADNSAEAGRQVENTDALAAAHAVGVNFQGGQGHAIAPPNYVPPADEGRPRH
jgi:hypothetical protein